MVLVRVLQRREGLVSGWAECKVVKKERKKKYELGDGFPSLANDEGLTSYKEKNDVDGS